MEEMEQTVDESSPAMNEAAESTARLLMFLREHGVPAEDSSNSADAEQPTAK